MARWLFYVNLTQARVILEGETSVEKMPRGCIFLIGDLCGKAQLIGDDNTPGTYTRLNKKAG